MNFTSKAQNYVTIPDANFVAWLTTNIPSAMNGNQMDTSSIAVKTLPNIVVGNSFIHDLTGLQYFSALTNLDCEDNQLTSLPSLPNSLQSLICYNNQLSSLPVLPDSLQTLFCYNNQLSNLPNLPNLLVQLACGNNLLTSLPALPNSLQELWCEDNQLMNLPVLPNSLWKLYCPNNHLTNLPALPLLQSLSCTNNQLTSLPVLPVSIVSLRCDHNNISCFEPFSNNMSTFPGDFGIWGNPFTCLPNYISAMDSITLAYPICINGDTINNPNGCNGLNCFANYTTSYDSVQNIFTLTIDHTTTSIATSYHWDFGDGSSSIIATPSHIYTVDSLYSVCLKIFTTSGDSCTHCHIIGIDSLGNIIRSSGFTLNVQNSTTMIDVFQNNSDKMQVSIYPNPFTSQTTVLFNKEMKNSSIKIVDMLGKKTNEINFTGKQLIIEKGQMKAGIYFLQVVDENKNLVNRKIIIN